MKYFCEKIGEELGKDFGEGFVKGLAKQFWEGFREGFLEVFGQQFHSLILLAFLVCSHRVWFGFTVKTNGNLLLLSRSLPFAIGQRFACLIGF